VREREREREREGKKVERKITKYQRAMMLQLLIGGRIERVK